MVTDLLTGVAADVVTSPLPCAMTGVAAGVVADGGGCCCSVSCCRACLMAARKAERRDSTGRSAVAGTYGVHGWRMSAEKIPSATAAASNKDRSVRRMLLGKRGRLPGFG